MQKKGALNERSAGFLFLGLGSRPSRTCERRRRRVSLFFISFAYCACGFSVKWHGSCRDSKHISWHLNENPLRTPHLLEFRTNGLLTARMLLGELSALRRVAEWRPQGKRTRVDVGPTQLKLKLRSIVDGALI